MVMESVSLVNGMSEVPDDEEAHRSMVKNKVNKCILCIALCLLIIEGSV